MDILSLLLGSGANASPLLGLLNPTAATNTPTPNPFAPRVGLLGGGLLGDAVHGAAAGAENSLGYTGLAALGAGASGAFQDARKRQQFNMQQALGGQDFAKGNLDLTSGRLGLQKTFEQYKYFKIIPQDMTFDQWVASAGQPGQAAAPGGPPASAPQIGQPPALDPTAQGGQPESTWQPSAAQGAPQVAPNASGNQAPAQSDNSYGIDPDLVGVTDPSAPKVQYALQRLSFNLGPAAAELAQKNIIAGLPYQTGLATVTAQAAANNANVQDRGAGTGVIALRTGPDGKPLPPRIITRNPVQVSGVDASGAPTTSFMFPPLGGEAGANGNTGAPPSSGGPPPNAPMLGQNNPGNIRPTGQSTGFRNYPDIASGIVGVVNNLQAYGSKGINTVSKIVSTWAPPSDNNDTQAYISDVAGKLGVDPNAPLDMTNSKVLTGLALAITNHEQGGIKAGAPAGQDGQGIVTGLSPFQQKRQGQFADTLNTIENSVTPSFQAEQRMMAIADALKQFQSGTFAQHFGQINAALKGVGLPEITSTDPAQVEIALKNNFQAAINTMQTYSSNPAAVSLDQAQRNFANPGMQPAANLAIISQGVGTLRWQRDMADAMQKAKLNGSQDPNEFILNWEKTHPMQGYIDRAEKEIGPLKGMETPQQGSGSTAVPPPPPGFTVLQ